MSTVNYQELAEKLVNFGRKNGASEIQVTIGRGDEFNVDVRNGEIEQLQEASSSSLGLKVIIDSKAATASSSDLSEATLQKLTLNAIERAKYANPDPFTLLPDPEKVIADSKSLKLYDQKILEVPAEKKIKMAKELEKICLADKRIKMSTGSSFGTAAGEQFIANSKGFSGSYTHTSCWTGVGLQSGSGDNFFEDGWWESSVRWDGIPSIEEIAKTAVSRVTRLIGAKKISTQNVPVIMEPSMTAEVLGFLSGCVFGDSIYMNQSFLAGKLNEKIASDIVNIVDDGLLPGAPGTRPFDGEGVPARKTVVIENGILKNYLLGTYAARKLKMKSTGNASGSTNFYLAPGNKTPAEIIKSVDKGLLLVQTIGQGTVPTSGDFSKGAYGIWIEKGELTYPVCEITISGNLGRMLKDIEMIGNDLKHNRSVTGPTILISEMTISGK